jgi:hypothetical protein
MQDYYMGTTFGVAELKYGWKVLEKTGEKNDGD